MLRNSFQTRTLHARTVRATNATFLVIAATCLAEPKAAAQQTGSMSKQSAALGISSPRVVQPTDIQTQRTGSAAAVSNTRRSASVRPIIIGVVLGGAVGAFVGHEVVGAPQSCPTSPGDSCGNSRLGTTGFAVSGALIGGLAAALLTKLR